MTAPRRSLALHCDEYLLTMAQSFWRHGQNERCAFELAVRDLPPHRGYLVVAGLEPALEYLQGLRFDEEMLGFLAGTGTYEPGFLDFLRSIRFSGDVDAVAEGTVVGATTPLLRITAERIEATLLESALLAIINHETMVASKAARIVDAAAGRRVWDFSLRRVHGIDAGLGVARAAYIAGAAGTATVVAGQRCGIPLTGTMAHQYVLRVGPDAEQRAFEQFLGDYPDRAILLVDTFDTRRGVDRAIAASRRTGVPLLAVRLDSGDLDSLCRDTRNRLDAAGMTETEIVASGDLDEWRIQSLLEAGAPVNSFGVGTMLGTSADAPHLTGVYKLVAQEGPEGMTPVMKWSAAKISDPGIHQLFREPGGDVLGLADEGLPGEPMLAPVMRAGLPVRDPPGLAAIRRRCARERARLPAATRRLDGFVPLVVRRSPGLLALRRRLLGGSAMPDTAATTRSEPARPPRTALIAVDVQGDFLPGGALAVAGGDSVIVPLTEAAAVADLVVATRDFHPPGHVSFAAQGGTWPEHCVAGTPGAALHPAIDAVADLVVSKGRDRDTDAYSGFDDTDLAAMLRSRGIERVLIGGLATDYCVRATAIDSVRAGFDTHLLLHAVRAVEVQPGDGGRAVAEMHAAGVVVDGRPPDARPGGRTLADIPAR